MKITITFDEENNEFADVRLDGKKVRMTKTKRPSIHQDSIGDTVMEKLFPAIRQILEIREYQERHKTWEVIRDEIVLSCLEEIK